MMRAPLEATRVALLSTCAWFVGCAWFSGCAMQPTATANLLAPSSIRIEERGKLWYVDAEVNGMEAVPFLIDTGTGVPLLDPALASGLGLIKNGSVLLHDAAGLRRRMPGYRVNTLALGSSVRFDNHRAYAMPSAGEFGRGVISSSLLNGLVVRLNWQHGEMQLSREPWSASADDLAMHEESGLPAIDVTIDGQTMRLVLDTGYFGDLLIPARDAIRLDLGPRISTSVSSTFHSQIRTFAHPVRGDLEIGPHTLHNPNISITTVGRTGLIGMTVLRRYEVWLDFIERRVKLVPLD